MRASFESGFQPTFLLVAVLALAGFLVTVHFVGRPRHAGPEGERLGADRAEADEPVSRDR